ncbi:MAG: hypothetical protein AB1641_17980 [Thermodesulfobacteriota bacterium]
MDRLKTEDLIVIRGLIIPAVWDETGRVTAVAVSAFNDNEYLVAPTPKAARLLGLLRREVEVQARLKEEGGRQVIEVVRYRTKRKRSTESVSAKSGNGS